jgi:hypothetical protein
MEEAVCQDIAGTGIHNWIFSNTGDTNFLYKNNCLFISQPGGTGIIEVTAGDPGVLNTPVYDKFLRALRNLNNDEDVCIR